MPDRTPYPITGGETWKPTMRLRFVTKLVTTRYPGAGEVIEPVRRLQQFWGCPGGHNGEWRDIPEETE